MPVRALVLLIYGTSAVAATVTAQSPGTFAATGDMSTGRSLHSATLLSDGESLLRNVPALRDIDTTAAS